MKPNGFSLIEVIVIMVVIGILASIGMFGFNSFMTKAKIERQAIEIFNDLNTARYTAIAQKRRHALVFQPDGYIFRRYTSLDESRTSTATAAKGTLINTKTTNFQMTKVAGGSIADRIFEFSVMGYTTDWDTIRINPINSGAAHDCIVVGEARINLGKMNANGTSCDFK